MSTTTIGYETTFDAAHRLPRHCGQCKNLHGHTYRIEVVVQGTGTRDGMILDFGILKQIVGDVLARWDHKTILQKTDPLARILLDNLGETCILEMEREPTVENMLDLVHDELSAALGGMVEVISIKLFETPTCWAELSF